MIIWNEKNSYETSYGVALYPDAKELRLSSRTLNYEKIRRKQELFKLARMHSMKFKEYLENAVKAVNITDKYCEFWPINDFEHLLEEANHFIPEHRSLQGYPQSHKITSHSPNSTGLYDSPNGSSISELERIGEFEVTQVQSSQDRFTPEEFDIMSSNHITIKPRLSRIYTQKFSKFKNPDTIGKVIVAVDSDGYQGKIPIQFLTRNSVQILYFTKSKKFLVSVIWRGNEDEYFQTRIEDIKLILSCIKRNNPDFISKINEDVSKL